MKRPRPYRAYDPFAPFYNLYWGDFYLDDAREGFSSHVLPRVPAGGRILDLCCGTGQMARWLTACGFAVVGLDSSPAMLAIARENAPAAEFVEADARAFRFDRPFDAALSTFDSINHLSSLDDVRRVFANVFAALHPGGLFVFDVNTQAGFLDAADESYAATEHSHVCVVRSSYDVASGVGLSKVTAFEPAGELWRRLDFEILEYHYPVGALKSALREAGFARTRTMDARQNFGMPRARGRVFVFAERPER